MTLTDPIADMLTRIRNAGMVRKKQVDIPSSNMKKAIAKILKDEGYIKNYKVIDDKKQGILRLILKYTEDKKNVISGMERVSKPGCRIFCKKDSIPKVLDGLGVVIISTSHGVFTGKKCEDMGYGGEVLCQIW
ncbi:MAG: 30S ribosomal protein S8 [Candidatus Aminicenantes bacterium]|nr:30S ribosomal protein S8 [Candidatus Aminicenantes bacterium]